METNILNMVLLDLFLLNHRKINGFYLLPLVGQNLKISAKIVSQASINQYQDTCGSGRLTSNADEQGNSQWFFLYFQSDTDHQVAAGKNE